MKTYELSFGRITTLSENLAEVIINENIEMTGKMVDEYHQFLLSHLKSPFSLLVNRINPYSYDENALHKIGSLQEIYKVAVVSYSNTSDWVIDFIKSLQERPSNRLMNFHDRDSALVWLSADND